MDKCINSIEFLYNQYIKGKYFKFVEIIIVESCTHNSTAFY